MDNTLFCSQEEPLIRQSLSNLVQETNLKSDRLELPEKETEQLSNFERKQQWSSGNIQSILKVLYEALSKSTDETRKRTLRLVAPPLLTKMLKEWAFTSAHAEFPTNLDLCGLIL